MKEARFINADTHTWCLTKSLQDNIKGIPLLKGPCTHKDHIIHEKEMSKGERGRYLDASYKTIIPGIQNKEAETFDDKDKEKRGQRTTLSNAMRSSEKFRGGPINQDNKICKGKTTHNLVDS